MTEDKEIGMYRFVELALSFPVVIFSLLLSLAGIYWLLVCCGIFDTDPVELDIEAISAYEKSLADSGKGLFSQLGLAGVPASVVLTLVSLIGWLLSYFIQLLLIEPLSLGFFYYPLGFVSGMLAACAALTTTALLVRLFRPLMKGIQGPPSRPICGRVAIVRSATVTHERGTALLEDGGAGLLLQVRTYGTSNLKRNDRVVLLQYIADEHLYHVISETEFLGQAL
jgi:hypothetical protein